MHVGEKLSKPTSRPEVLNFSVWPCTFLKAFFDLEKPVLSDNFATPSSPFVMASVACFLRLGIAKSSAETRTVSVSMLTTNLIHSIKASAYFASVSFSRLASTVYQPRRSRCVLIAAWSHDALQTSPPHFPAQRQRLRSAVICPHFDKLRLSSRARSACVRL